MKNEILRKIYNKVKENKLSLAPFLIFFVLLIAGEIVSPGFASWSHVRYILIITVPYGVMGIGQTFVILSGREDLDFSVGAMGSLSVVLAAQFFGFLSFPVTILLILLIGAGFGLLNGVGVRIFKVPPLVMTFGTASVMIGTGIAYTGGLPRGTTHAFLRTLSTGRIAGQIPYVLILWLALTIITVYILHKTTYGRCLYAAGSNPEATQVAGISTNKIGIIAYVFSGLFAALAGLLILGRIQTPAQFEIAEPLTLPVIAGVVLGGTNFFGGEGGYIGTIGGVLALVTLRRFLPRLGLPDYARLVVDGIILVVILLIYARRASLRK